MLLRHSFDVHVKYSNNFRGATLGTPPASYRYEQDVTITMRRTASLKWYVDIRDASLPYPALVGLHIEDMPPISTVYKKLMAYLDVKNPQERGILFK